MKKEALLTLTLLIVLALVGTTSAWASDGPTTINYGNMTLTGGYQAGHFSDWWDLTAGDLTLSFTYNANGLVDDLGGSAHAWAELGVRSACYGDFNPTWMVEGAGVWLATDYDWSANTFDPDPAGAPTLDLDDKLILQKGGGMAEGAYNLPSTPPNPWANHRVWFDRDGVDQWQAQNPLAVDGGTYNTGGTYDIVITLHADNPAAGRAYMTVNGLNQGFETDGNWNTMELSPAGMTFSGDMTHLQVFYGLYGYGATHAVAFNNITVGGQLTGPPLAPCFEQAIDIKPGSDPNAINLSSNGIIPVAILGSASLDVNDIDPSTVTLEGAGLRLKGKSGNYGSLEDVNGDTYVDLVVHISDFTVDSGATTATLTGYLWNGAFFWGTDEILIVQE